MLRCGKRKQKAEKRRREDLPFESVSDAVTRT